MNQRQAKSLFTFAENAHFWNDLYERPASLFEHHMRWRRDYAARFIAHHFPPETRLLDLGCGAGVLSEKLLELGFAVTAADASSDMLTLARNRLARFPAESVRLARADCLALPFAERQFDLVVCLGMFGYFDDVSQALAEIRRVLRPGGTLVISVRNAHTHRVFDLLEILKHPLRLGRSLLRHRHGRPPVREQPPAAAGDDFRIAIYQAPGALIEGISRRGFRLLKFDGLGYGPLAFGGRKLLSEARAIRLSTRLERLFRATGFIRVSRWFADVSFYVFQRSP